MCLLRCYQYVSRMENNYLKYSWIIFSVKQGESLSPILFLFSLMTFNKIFQIFGLFDSIRRWHCNVRKIEKYIAKMLDKLSFYFRRRNITLNDSKTKIVVFRNGWKPISDTFYFNNKEVEIRLIYVYTYSCCYTIMSSSCILSKW